ncbi:unnamed protein product [Allacma fusca]|uniref:Uncharacterized protein n=1 Tax=Allacma fusca TaxID=39272 RepID=A0A8J2KSN3_9HEXA|nr:unnamed protein product [Allacma fusca]
MGACKLVVLFLALVSVIWTHHCEDEDNPYARSQDCPKNKLHVCYGLVEDMQSFTCRCDLDTNCREPCGFNVFRAWSSAEGSWISPLKKDPTIPHIGIDSYIKCAKGIPIEPTRPHKLNYTMCMCNDHYYSFGFAITSAERKNFTTEFQNVLKTEKPKLYVLGSANHAKNLPYVDTDTNFRYRKCKDVSVGEDYHPPGHLGTDWCSLKYCQENNPFGKGIPGAKYKVMKCAETCTCFLEPSTETNSKAAERNKLLKY